MGVNCQDAIVVLENLLAATDPGDIVARFPGGAEVSAPGAQRPGSTTAQNDWWESHTASDLLSVGAVPTYVQAYGVNAGINDVDVVFTSVPNRQLALAAELIQAFDAVFGVEEALQAALFGMPSRMHFDVAAT